MLKNVFVVVVVVVVVVVSFVFQEGNIGLDRRCSLL